MPATCVKLLTFLTQNCQNYKKWTQCARFLDNPKANQEPFKSPKANANLIKYAHESFIQCDIFLDLAQQNRGHTKNSLVCSRSSQRNTNQRSIWTTTNRAWWYLKNKGEATGVLFLTKQGCWYLETYQSLPKMPKKKIWHTSGNIALAYMPVHCSKPNSAYWLVWTSKKLHTKGKRWYSAWRTLSPNM